VNMSSKPQDDVEHYEPPKNLKARIAQTYDMLAHTYNEWTLKHASPRIIWLRKALDKMSQPTHIKNQDQPGTQVLELGAGAGIPTTKAILDHDANIYVVANDLSKVQLSLLQTNLASYDQRITLLPGDMLSLSPAAGSLSAVIAMYSIIHLPQEEQKTLLKKISTWLRPGGVFLANFGVEEAKENVLENWLKKDAWVYWSGLGIKGTIEACEKADLRVLEQEVISGNGVDADFLWLLAQKPKEPSTVAG
jgi:cyclopropane fatty-acyl-phospholipid synthase-like methyltransferase